MIPEDERTRRGEPVLVIDGKHDELRREGTIEWGGVTQPASIYLERGGRMTGIAAYRLVADPGGKRPVWDKVTGRSPNT